MSEERGLDGPEAAEAALVHWPETFGLALQLTGRRADAEDICQEAFLRLTRSKRRLDGSRPLLPLLLRIVRNLVFDRHRRSTPVLIEDFDPADSDRAKSPFESLAIKEEEQAVTEILAEMSPRWRGALYLRDGLDLSYREIGETLDMTEDVVRVTLHRARSRLREALDRRLMREEET